MLAGTAAHRALQSPPDLQRPVGGSPQGATRRDLLRVVGQPRFTAQSADAGVRPALARMTQALNLAGASVVAADGRVLAAGGPVTSDAGAVGATPAIPLVVEDELVGELRISGTRSGRGGACPAAGRPHAVSRRLPRRLPALR